MRVCVYGLWHLGCVTAACLAEAGFHVVGLDPDENVIADLQKGKAPLHEPGLDDLIARGQVVNALTFTTDPAEALARADVVWVCFDTPVDDDDHADVEWVRQRLEDVRDHLRPCTVVLISSQVPVGFTSGLEDGWAGRGLRFASSPENLRLGKALDCFRRPERIVVGVRDQDTRQQLAPLFAPFRDHVVWMSVESAEMTKHAINAFLALSVTFINELSRVCESVGADAKEVERGLKSEGRIGPKAYLSPGSAFAGGTLARDVGFLIGLGIRHGIEVPLFRGVRASNDLHKHWARQKLDFLLGDLADPVVAVLGLTYKPGTNTLRRSAALELCAWLNAQGVRVQAHDPAVRTLPVEVENIAALCDNLAQALAGADAVVIATEWPEFQALHADQLLALMRRPRVLDPNRFLATHLSHDPRILYLATGNPLPATTTGAGGRAA